MKTKEILPQVVVEAVFEIDKANIEKIESIFGKGVLPKGELILSRGYSNELYWELEVNEGLAISHIAKSLGVEQPVRELILQQPTLKRLAEALDQNAQNIQKRHTDELARANAMDDSDPRAKQAALAAANAIREPEQTQKWRSWALATANSGLPNYIYDNYVRASLPVFLYFDEFYQMEGHVNVPALKARQGKNPTSRFRSTDARPDRPCGFGG